MAPFQILTFSPKTSFLRKIQDLLSSSPGFQLKNIPSLPGDIPSDIGKEDWIGILDLDSQSEPPDVVVNIIQNHYPENQFLLLSKELSSLPSSSTAGLHLINIDALSSSLFIPFLTSLAEKSTLITAKLQAETDLNKRLSELLLIRKASLHLTMNLSLDSVLESILESAMELVSADDTHVFLYEHGVLSFAAALFDGHQQRRAIHESPTPGHDIQGRQGREQE